MEYMKLANGQMIPAMGYGCYNAFGDEMTRSIISAVESGYRYIDSASKYGNEDAVGKGIAACDCKREELFVLSKVWPDDYENVEAAAMKTLKDLQVEYLDAYLIHWPGTDETRRLKAYEQMLKLQEKGICRIAAVSNFMIDQLEVLKREFGQYPVINELEMHPTYQQGQLNRFCSENGIVNIAYMPINRSRDLSDPSVLSLAEKYSKTPAQVVLRWHMQEGRIPIPKSSNPARIKENIDIFDFMMTEEEVKSIDAMEAGIRSGLDPLTFNGVF